MLRYAVTYVATFVIMLVIDFGWLSTMAGPLYRATLGDVLLENFRPAPAIVFYLLYVAGIMIFVLPRDADTADWRMVALFGALFGLVSYATYDLTNFATIKPWTLTLTLADMAWGAALTAVGSTLGMLLGAWVVRLIGK
jgi:uncharacterized membrane protein